MDRKRLFPALPLMAATLLSACAGAPGDYPSLAIRDAERLSGTIPAPPPAPTPQAPTPATLDRLATLESAADAAHAAFLAEVPRASSIVRSARGAGVGSEAWARASVALGSLVAARSATMIPLADLDRLLVEAAVELDAVQAIAEVRDSVAAEVAVENATIAELEAVLAQ